MVLAHCGNNHCMYHYTRQYAFTQNNRFKNMEPLSEEMLKEEKNKAVFWQKKNNRKREKRRRRLAERLRLSGPGTGPASITSSALPQALHTVIAKSLFLPLRCGPQFLAGMFFTCGLASKLPYNSLTSLVELSNPNELTQTITFVS